MIRWRFIITRLVVICAILFLIAWGLGPVAGYVTVRGLEAVTGAKVDVASTNFDLMGLSIRYEDIDIADPRADKGLRNLVSAEAIELNLDGRALMQRRWVAETAKITGIEIGSQRLDNGHYEAELVDPVDNSGPSALTQWIADAGGKLGDAAEDFRDDLETVRKGNEIRARWEQQYVDQTARAKALENSVRTIRDRIKGINNPLRDYQELQRTIAESKAAREDLIRISAEIKSLPDRWRSDMAAMEAAKQIDLAKIDEFVPGDFSGADELGVDLVKDAVRKQIETIRSYLDGGKALANYTVLAPGDLERTRGTQFHFDVHKRPELLIRKCLVNGVLRADGKVYSVSGWVDNLTPTPERLTKPTVAKLRLEGPDTVQVQYACDRRSEKDIDVVTLHWPTMDGDAMSLGKPGEAEFAVDGGNRELWIQIHTEGDQVNGHLISKQTGVRLSLETNEETAQLAAVKSLAGSLDAINQITVDARFNGTWDQFRSSDSWNDLAFNINTNLGRELQSAAKDAIAQQALASRELVTGKINSAFAQQQSQLADWIKTHEAKAQEMLALSDSMLESIGNQVVNEMGQGDVYIGRLQQAIKNLR